MKVNTTYEPFSLQPEYIEENRAFLHRPSYAGVERILDLACGNGGSTELLLEAKPSAHLNGVDSDPVQIDLVEDRFTKLGYTVRRGFELTDEIVRDRPVIVFGVGSADDLFFPDSSFDCVTIANAIHMLPDKQKLVAEAARVLRPDGLLGFNTSFYAGTFPEGTESFHSDWLKLAAQAIARRSQEQIAAGKGPIKRRRRTTHGAFQNRWLTIAEWTDVLAKEGLEIHDLQERIVMLDERCFISISAYAGFAEVLLSGYPVEDASWALQSTVAPALEAFNSTTIPRKWLEVWARKSER